ncbi:MAG: hypothetical protein C5B55_03635 [Blastocatellia bacterium]|nr:MAG: hypothetical protein C5B55_03635 [Blastocatellia bacterium]
MLNRFRIAFLLLPTLAVIAFTDGPRFTQSSPQSTPFVVEAASCPLSANPITWFPEEVACPVCGTKNIFLVWGSYGSYIYSYPSKYQLIFWPYTDGAAWYSCKKCKLTLFLEDFQKVPKEKIPDLQKLLAEVTLPAQKVVSDKEALDHPPYLEIPVSARLTVAEKVYRSLGLTSDVFWSQFYRVLGYHHDIEGNSAEAAEARKKALSIVEGWLTDKTKQGQRKEFLYICAAMHHFLNDDPAATKTLEEAAKLKYSNAELKPEQNENYDQYLSTVIKEYIDLIKKGEVPKR